MLIADKLKQLREEVKQPQKRVAAALNIDTATYGKMEISAKQRTDNSTV